jgi:predicted dehydrogenase
VSEKVGAGIIGTGNIFPAYVKGCRAFEILEIMACADMDGEKARQCARQFDIPRVCSVEELLADTAIEIVVNLTVPKAHKSACRLSTPPSTSTLRSLSP